METPHKFIISILLFWLILGGLLQLFNIDDNNSGKLNANTEQEVSNSIFDNALFKKISFIWDLMTFNVGGIPDEISFLMTSFFTSSLVLSIYVLVRSGS